MWTRWRRLAMGLAGGLAIALSARPAPAQGLAPLEEVLARARSVASFARPSPMVTVPAGWFLMGSPPNQDDRLALEAPADGAETPQRRIWLAAYAIDRDEVTWGSYLAVMLRNPGIALSALHDFSDLLSYVQQMDGVPVPPDRVLASWPVFFVTWSEAADYCRVVGKRLPTEAEWEKAARGTDGRLFPWGRTKPDTDLAVFGQANGGAVPLVDAADTLPKGRSPYGLHHVAGNVAEWVQDWYAPDWYRAMPERNPTGPTRGREKVLRGGSWKSEPALLRAATRRAAPPERRDPAIGFRCADSPS